MKVDRDGWVFEVVDDPATRAWNFWEDQFATGVWEPRTLDLIDNLAPDDTYLDIGSWVGPTVLWGARLAGRVVAVEPDPVAADVLEANVAANPGLSQVDVVRKAVAAPHQQWPQPLSSPPGGQLGDSCTSVLHHGANSISAEPTTIDDLLGMIDGHVGLVKIDIEGAEGLVFPAAEATLRALGCPIILALHLPWIGQMDRNDLLGAVNRFKVEVLDDSNPQFPTVALYSSWKGGQ